MDFVALIESEERVSRAHRHCAIPPPVTGAGVPRLSPPAHTGSLSTSPASPPRPSGVTREEHTNYEDSVDDIDTIYASDSDKTIYRDIDSDSEAAAARIGKAHGSRGPTAAAFDAPQDSADDADTIYPSDGDDTVCGDMGSERDLRHAQHGLQGSLSDAGAPSALGDADSGSLIDLTLEDDDTGSGGYMGGPSNDEGGSGSGSVIWISDSDSDSDSGDERRVRTHRDAPAAQPRRSAPDEAASPTNLLVPAATANSRAAANSRATPVAQADGGCGACGDATASDDCVQVDTVSFASVGRLAASAALPPQRPQAVASADTAGADAGAGAGADAGADTGADTGADAGADADADAGADVGAEADVGADADANVGASAGAGAGAGCGAGAGAGAGAPTQRLRFTREMLASYVTKHDATSLAKHVFSPHWRAVDLRELLRVAVRRDSRRCMDVLVAAAQRMGTATLLGCPTPSTAVQLWAKQVRRAAADKARGQRTDRPRTAAQLLLCRVPAIRDIAPPTQRRAPAAKRAREVRDPRSGAAMVATSLGQQRRVRPRLSVQGRPPSENVVSKNAPAAAQRAAPTTAATSHEPNTTSWARNGLDHRRIVRNLKRGRVMQHLVHRRNK